MKKNVTIRVIFCALAILLTGLYLYFAWPTRLIFFRKPARVLDPDGKYGPFDLWGCLSSDAMNPGYKAWCCFAFFGGIVVLVLALLSLLFAFLKKKSLFFTFPLIALSLFLGFVASFTLSKTGEVDFGYGVPRFLVPLVLACISSAIAEFFAWKKSSIELPY